MKTDSDVSWHIITSLWLIKYSNNSVNNLEIIDLHNNLEIIDPTWELHVFLSDTKF